MMMTRRRTGRRGLAALGAVALGLATAGSLAVTTAAPAAAADCPNPVFGLLPSATPTKDMALGFLNGTSHNAPLAMRDSSGLSRAELWREVPAPFAGFIALQNLDDDEALFNAATNGQSSGSAVVAKKANLGDATQLFKKSIVAGKVTYTSATSNKRITNVPSAISKPFQQFFPGEGGDQLFTQKIVACS